jgi:NitT/TauT family transport system permease protein
MSVRTEDFGPGRLRALFGLVVPLAVLVAAQAVAALTHLRSDTLAAPSDVFIAGVAAFANGTLIVATLQTLIAALLGLTIGAGLGVGAGILLGLSRVADRLSFVALELLRPIPAIALIPVVMLAFGFGYRLEVSIVAFATLWPTLILSRAAVASVDPILFEVSSLLGLDVFGLVRNIVLPAALPRIFVALRLAAGAAMIVAITVEVTANPLGLGYFLMSAEQSLRPATMLAVLFWICFVGWSLNVALHRIERHAFSFDTRGGAEQ